MLHLPNSLANKKVNPYSLDVGAQSCQWGWGGAPDSEGQSCRWCGPTNSTQPEKKKAAAAMGMQLLVYAWPHEFHLDGAETPTHLGKSEHRQLRSHRSP